MTYDNETMLSTGYRDVHSPQVCKEANIPSLVASDGREDHDLFLPTLPAVDCLHVGVLEMILQGLLDPRCLSRVRRHEADLRELESGFEIGRAHV